jgi:2-keto-4-pentenoate hydratase/2-oxohepta-3-ene-1,7-dioic acid hydratase in catechol pathway
MKFASYILNGRQSFGLAVDGGLFDLGSRVPDPQDTLLSRLQRGSLDDLRVFAPDARAELTVEDVTFLPPIVKPGKTLCVGVNYRNRPGEFGKTSEPEYPSLFMRGCTAQTGHLQPILRPLESEQLDYEGEIALIIGRTGRRISEADAMSYVTGYACFNEGSIRDWMKHGIYNVTAGKNFDNSGSFGPWLVTPDEIKDPTNMRLSTRVNGVTVQEDTTANMIAPFTRLISYISTFTTLEPGDVIVTGTPTGSGSKMNPPRWLQPGDVLEVEVEGVGILRNPVLDEREFNPENYRTK